MKKVTKILSGTLLVALMSLGLATKLNVKEAEHLEVRDVLTEDMTKPVTGKVVKKVENVEPANKLSLAKAQVSEVNEGKRHIRFVAGLDSVAYAGAKFDIVVKDGDTVVKTFANQEVTTAYTHVVAADEVLSAAEAFGEEYNYMIAYTVENVPEEAWGYTFEVTSSVKVDDADEWATTDVVSKVVNVVAKQDEVANTVVDLTSNLIVDYNVETLAKTEEKYEGTKTAIMVTGVTDSGRVYSGVKSLLTKETNLKNSKMSFYVKLVENVYKNRVSMQIYKDDSAKLDIILTNGNGTGYTVDALENDWYYVVIDIDEALTKAEHFMSDTIRLGYANQDTTAVSKLIIADMKITVPTEIVEDQPSVSTSHDYSDDLVLSYGCNFNADENVSFDGKKSVYYELLDSVANSTGGLAFYPDTIVEGKTLSFYVKVDTPLYKDRVTLQLRDKDRIVELEFKIVLNANTIAGVTVEQVEDGWYHIVLDCDSVDTKGLEIHMIRFLLANPENAEVPAAIWIDQINLLDK